ncbi:uncharacterized protein [Hyperolius riggenbachi]|uniref:uncharacterized protein n=1 Tax=Hyperolius riggenbachi TaxID=752182 RepID=UPI0035A3CA46
MLKDEIPSSGVGHQPIMVSVGTQTPDWTRKWYKPGLPKRPSWMTRRGRRRVTNPVSIQATEMIYLADPSYPTVETRTVGIQKYRVLGQGITEDVEVMPPAETRSIAIQADTDLHMEMMEKLEAGVSDANSPPPVETSEISIQVDDDDFAKYLEEMDRLDDKKKMDVLEKDLNELKEAFDDARPFLLDNDQLFCTMQRQVAEMADRMKALAMKPASTFDCQISFAKMKITEMECGDAPT